jgi:tRNA A37 methylthiotransferase MiaB
MKKKRIYVEGQGCSRRMLEKTKIMEYLRVNGYEFVSRPANADYILLITCAFKKAQEDHSLLRLDALRRHEGQLLVYGCLPDIRPDIIRDIDGIKALAPKDLDRIDGFFDGISVRYAEIAEPRTIDYYDRVSLLEKAKAELFSREHMLQDHYHRFFSSAKEHLRNLLIESRRNCFLYVCRGCLGSCTYCAIRRAIGPVRSKPLSQVLTEFRDGFTAGLSHFHVLGDDLGCYGLDIGCTLPILLTSLLQESDDLEKSLGSHRRKQREIHFHLKEVSFKYLVEYEECLNVFESERIKSLLCPIQSGSDRILGLMKREHSADDVRRVVAKIRATNPGLQLSTQIIVGFPSETDQDFVATLDILEELRLDDVVVFPYHAKENTPASKLNSRIPDEVIRERLEEALTYLKCKRIKAYTQCPL